MLTAKGAAHIRTSRQARSFRACPTATGVAMGAVEAQRIAREEAALARCELRRIWLAEGWQSHVLRRRRT